jgi:hypothetical protein
MYFIISSCTDTVVCFDLRHASVRPDYMDINFLVDIRTERVRTALWCVIHQSFMLSPSQTRYAAL